MTTIKLSQVNAIIEAAISEWRPMHLSPLAVAVLDMGGNLIAFKREDGADFFRFDIAYGKAWGALGLGFGTREIAERAAKLPTFYSALAAASQGRMISQYVILGAGLDTFAQRNSETLALGMQVFEIDQTDTQEWKRQRLIELGLGIPPFLHLVPVNFEAGEDWWERLSASGFDFKKPTVVASTGVSMYLTKDAIMATLRQAATLARDSTFVMSFMLPIELNDPEIRHGVERAAAGAKANGTPWLSFFTPDEMLTLAREAGFENVEHISAAALAKRYFSDRTDGLRPPSNSEELLVANTLRSNI